MDITCDDREFEIALGVLYERMGYIVEVTKATGDGGIDLNVFKPGSFWIRCRRRYIVQAKHWENGVSSPEVHRLYGTLMHERAEGAILITSSYFTKGSVAFAQGKPIELIDGVALRAMIERYGLHHEFSENASYPNPTRPPNSTSPRLLSLLAVGALVLLSFACYSVFHHLEKGPESVPLSLPIPPRGTPQQVSTPAPEVKATEPIATSPTPVAAKTPPPMPTASADANERAMQKYPHLGVAGSPFNRLFVLRYNRYREDNPDFFAEPEWPTKLADECAKFLGTAPQQPTPSVKRK